MIGVFDSGSGGLSVLKVLREQAPDADIVYFGDLNNMPYGNKSREELGALTVLGIEKLINEGATEIVSACNSVSVSIVLPMFEILDLPRANIIEMVGPTVASFKDVQAKVLVVATKATVESGIYQEGLRMVGSKVDGVAIPELVTAIEGGASNQKIENIIQKALAPYTKGSYTHLVLGCTHYPLVRDSFECMLRKLSMHVTVVDPANSVVDSVVTSFDTTGQGGIRFLVSKENDVFKSFVNRHFPDILVDIEVV